MHGSFHFLFNRLLFKVNIGDLKKDVLVTPVVLERQETNGTFESKTKVNMTLFDLMLVERTTATCVVDNVNIETIERFSRLCY